MLSCFINVLRIRKRRSTESLPMRNSYYQKQLDRCESVIFSGELNCHKVCLEHLCKNKGKGCQEKNKERVELRCRSEEFKQYDWRYRLKYCNETIDKDSYNYSQTNIMHLDRLAELTKEPVEFENVYKV